MKAAWRVDGSWTGNWVLPECLKRPLTTDERDLLVRMSCGGIGPARLVREAWSCQTLAELSEVPLRNDPAPALAALHRSGARTIFVADAEYPDVLSEIAAPPPLLYVRGRPLTGPFVAIVGSRVCTKGAARFARRLAATLAEAGFTVVSGLARGIDEAAHTGALEAGSTVAVLGTGINRVYPSEHAALAEWIVADGALVGEFAPGTGPRPWHFPARNRIVSGLCMAVIVVEAGLGSGALITAGFALDQGREVLACLTGPDNAAGAGVREMLRDGARLVIDPVDTLAELAELAIAQGFVVQTPAQTAIAKTAELEGPASAVFHEITEDATVDQIVAATGLGAGQVAACLAELQMSGLVTSDSPGRYTRLALG